MRASYRPGLGRDEICRIIYRHSGLPDGVEIPQDLIDWHSWQNGSVDFETIRASEDLARSFAPWDCGPVPLEAGFETYESYSMREGDDIVVPLLGMPNDDFSYRIAANGRWHMSLFEPEAGDMYWTVPEDSTRAGAEPIGQEWVTITQWLTELNNAIEDRRITRAADYKGTATADIDMIPTHYPWMPE